MPTPCTQCFTIPIEPFSCGDASEPGDLVWTTPAIGEEGDGAVSASPSGASVVFSLSGTATNSSGPSVANASTESDFCNSDTEAKTLRFTVSGSGAVQSDGAIASSASVTVFINGNQITPLAFGVTGGSGYTGSLGGFFDIVVSGHATLHLIVLIDGACVNSGPEGEEAGMSSYSGSGTLVVSVLP